MRGIFVTGTDTGVGKTVVAAALMHFLREREPVVYWKPVQTGIEEDDDTATVRELGGCSDGEIWDQGFRLERPLSPHLSARLAGVRITLGEILKDVPEAGDESFKVVEGAGGILVPLNGDDLMTDLMKALDLPVLIAARSGLGTINHTLLTLEALRRRSLGVVGVILNGEPNPENRKAIEHYGETRVLAEMPKFEKLDVTILKKWSENIEPWR